MPSIDLIDFNFPCWHQTCDDLTAVSKASLGQERRGRARVPQEALSARRIAAAERSTSASVVAQPDTEMRIASRPCQTVPPTQHVPSAWMRATALGRRGDEHLVEHDVVEDLGAAVAQQRARSGAACAQ